MVRDDNPTRMSNEQLVEAIKAGDQYAMTTLLKINEGAIYRIMKRLHIDLNDQEDALQEGRIAITQAVQTFDPSRGVLFISYVWRRIFWRISRLKKDNHLIRGRNGTRVEISSLDCRQSEEALSWLETKIDDSALYPDDIVSEREQKTHTAQRLSDGLERLSAREREVVRRRFKGEALRGIADSIGLSKEGVRRIASRALGKLSRDLRKGDR